MINASLRRLSVFKAVYELGGVNAAADHLDIAQPSVSAHIKALETELGASLFVRQRGRRLRPTEGGEALYRYSCNILAASRETQDTLHKLQRNGETLTIGLQRSIAGHIVQQHLAGFLARHQAAQVSIHSETQEGMSELLHRNGIDIGLLFAPVEASGYISEIIGHEPLVLIAAPTHPLARKRSIAPAEVEKHDFVGPIQKSQFYKLIDTELRRIGLRSRKTTLSLQDTASVKQAVSHGLGIACTLQSTCVEEVQRNEVVVLDLDAPKMSLSVQCTYRTPPGLPKLGVDFMRFLRQATIWPPRP